MFTFGNTKVRVYIYVHSYASTDNGSSNGCRFIKDGLSLNIKSLRIYL